MPKQQPKADPLADALAQIEKQFGAGAVIEGDAWHAQDVAVIPTGSLALDYALGVGGLARGRVVEVYGPEGSGKSTLCQHVAANVQAAGGKVAYIDAEHALDPDYARAIGVSLAKGKWYLSQPDSGEQALEIAERLIRSGQMGVVIVDSVAALVPQAEIDGDMGDSHVGLQARLMSQALRKLTGPVSTTRTLCVFVNQLREKIGVFYGNPEVTTGGRALKFYSSVRLDIRAIETLKDGPLPIGKRTRVKVVKNKLSAPFKEAQFDILFGTGINREGELLDLGVQYQVLRKTGSWYYWDRPGAKEPLALGQGKEAARAWLTASKAEAAALEQALRTMLAQRLSAPPVPAPEGPAPAKGTGRKLEEGDLVG